MLKLYFFNVGDGDSILLEEQSADGVYRILVDAGRECIDQPSPSAPAARHLQALGVEHLDQVIITHLHIDHMGGLRELLDTVAVDRVVSAYFPPEPGLQAPEEPEADKTVRGMIDCLNFWSETAAGLAARGCRLEGLTEAVSAEDATRRLRVLRRVPSVETAALQRDVWDRMLRGEPAGAGRKFAAAKARNPNSTLLRLTYAGRQIVLGADCYGEVWDGLPLEACDLLKVPHHGDRKALTPRLVKKLRPRHAVISCGREYLPLKDRPSAETRRLLRGCGAAVWYTDAFDDGGEVRSWPWVRFVVYDDGRIETPEDDEEQRVPANL